MNTYLIKIYWLPAPCSIPFQPLEIRRRVDIVPLSWSSHSSGDAFSWAMKLSTLDITQPSKVYTPNLSSLGLDVIELDQAGSSIGRRPETVERKYAWPLPASLHCSQPQSWGAAAGKTHTSSPATGEPPFLDREEKQSGIYSCKPAHLWESGLLVLEQSLGPVPKAIWPDFITGVRWQYVKSSSCAQVPHILWYMLIL